MKRTNWNNSFYKKREVSFAANPHSSTSHSPTWKQGGGRGNGGSLEDAPWLLRGLPSQGAEWLAWCAACGSWS